MLKRKEALEKYRKAKRDGKVDEDIISLLDTLNLSSDFYTTSSCSGRIVLLNLPEIEDKKNATFLGKWHKPVIPEEVKNSIDRYEDGYLFILMQSPIIHVVCKDVVSAQMLIRIALECGFKYSSIKNISDDSVLVEILSTENLNVPLGKEGNVVVEKEDINFFVEMANKLLLRSKEKLKCLERKINSLLLSSS